MTFVEYFEVGVLQLIEIINAITEAPFTFWPSLTWGQVMLGLYILGLVWLIIFLIVKFS